MNTNNPLLARHINGILGVISCFDRIIITGTVPGVCYAQGMTSILYEQGIRIFSFPEYAKGFAKELEANAKRLAKEAGIEIEYLPSPRKIRKEERIAEILQQRGTAPGLVHIFSELDTCHGYKPWHNKQTHKTYLISCSGKCLHYYFYFIDEELGLCYLRVPTWIPFRLQFYCNGHNWLASQLSAAEIPFTLVDNAFIDISDFEKAQQLSDSFRAEALHPLLDQFAQRYCPVIQHFTPACHWSLMQVEYATDIIFSNPDELDALHEALKLSAMHEAKPQNISSFLGHAWHGRKPDDIGSRLNTRAFGTCAKHYCGRNSIKMYDKFGCVLRIETTSNDVSFFKHYRKVEHRNGTSEMKQATLKKTIYSLPVLRELMQASNQRYLAFLADLEDPSPGIMRLEKLAQPVQQGTHRYRGFNLFDANEFVLFQLLLNGGFAISGFRNRDLRAQLSDKTSAQVSYLLKRLLTHGLIKKIGNTYKYYLTAMGRKVIAAALEIRRFYIIPRLAGAHE